jgi:tetratricopeptide (TPR) repeat protein
MGKVVEFFRLYGGWVGLAAGLVFVAIIGGVLLGRMNTSKAIDRSNAFLKAAAPLAAQASTKPDADPEAMKTAAADEKNRAKQALADLDKFLAENGKTDLAPLAGLAKGAAAYHAGDAAAAATAWKAWLDANATSPLAWLAWESYGIAADQTGNRAEAEKAFGEVVKSDSMLARAYGYLHLGDLYNPLTKARDGDPVDRAKALDFYQKGADALNGPAEKMPGPQLIARKTLDERLQTVR